MSGIFGLVSRHGDVHIDDSDCDAMRRSLGAGDRDQDRQYRWGGGVLGAVSRSAEPADIAEGTLHGARIVVAFHGTLYPNRETAGAVLEAYRRDGPDFPKRLRGEFAVAIWDGARQVLYLATDRFAVHPLLYYWDGTKIVFASRMKSLLACPSLVKPSIDPEAIVDVVGSSVISAPKTIFRELKKISAGHLVEFRDGQMSTRPYWDVDFSHPDSDSKRLAPALRSALADAVAVRLRGDAPADRVGTFLSGGVDSSTVTALVSQLAGRPRKAFSVGFAEAGFNEIDYARISARHVQADHAEYFVTPEDVARALPIVLNAFDEPFANASAIPTYYCAKLAREHGVDVMYAGDGGDELFAGNERYATQRLFDYYGRVPMWTRRYMEPLVKAGADRLGWSPLVAGKKYIRRANIPYPDRLCSWAFFSETPLSGVFDDGFVELLGKSFDPYGALRQYYRQAPATTELDHQLYIDLKLAIADNDVVKVTRMADAAGVSVRYPFLDHPFVEFAASVPAVMKMRGRQLRTFFKDAYRDVLHPDTLKKRKHGFGLPIATWLRTDRHLNEMMHDLVLSPHSVQRGYFKRSALEHIVQEHGRDQSSYYGTILWNVMILEAWQRTAGW